MNEKTLNLIRYIICHAADRDTRLTSLRLVKFVYLADLFYARHFGGETLTGLPWAFVYYGPYCREVMQHIDFAASQGLIERKGYEGKYSKDFFLYFCPEGVTEELETFFPLAVTSGLKRVIEKFGDDTAALLDYVYFGTEPMIDARKGDLLDFSKARDYRPVEEPIRKISPNEINLARKHAKALTEKFKKGLEFLKREETQIAEWKDEAYFRTLEIWDREDLQTGLTGTAEIKD